MADLIADLFVSVDGFAGGKEVGPFFGYGGPELDAWVQEQLDQPQLVLMGRVTYEVMAAISAASPDEAGRMNKVPKAVFSNTLSGPLSWPNTRLLRGDLADVVRAAKRDSDTPVRTIGSLTLVRGLLEHGLVDRLRLMVFPLTLGGDGLEPAYFGYPRAGLQLVEARVLDSRVVLLTYRP